MRFTNTYHHNCTAKRGIYENKLFIKKLFSEKSSFYNLLFVSLQLQQCHHLMAEKIKYLLVCIIICEN